MLALRASTNKSNNFVNYRRLVIARRPGTTWLNKAGAMVGLCRLCQKEADLQFGHIFPRFAVKWLKKTSATGFLRTTGSSEREQDSEREYLMCAACEQILSKDEKVFSEQIFIPYHERGETVFEYGPWLGRFLAGLHFKVINCRSLDSGPKNVTEIIDATKMELRNFLLGQSDKSGRAEFHLFFGDVVQDANYEVPSKFNWYMSRSLDASLVSNLSGTVGVYAKFLKIMTFSFLTPRNTVSERWEGTQIFEKGTLKTPQEIESKGLGSFITDRVKAVARAIAELPPKENERIAKSAIGNPERALASESYRTYLADKALRQRLEERAAQARLASPAGRMKGRDRNSPCRCGSGKKFKKCHGG